MRIYYHTILVGCFALFYLFMFLTGCNDVKKVAVDVTAISAAAVMTHSEYTNAEHAIERNINLFTPDEKTKLAGIKIQLDSVHNTINGLVKQKDVSQVLIEIAQLKSLITETEGAYLEAKSIVNKHLDQFPVEDRLTILEFENSADRLRNKWHEQLALAQDNQSVNATQVIIDILTIAGGVAKVVAPLVI